MYHKLSVDDNYETPPDAWELILRYLPKHLILWDPFHCHGSSRIILEAFGFTIIHHRADYFTYEPAAYDICLTNPPFSKKKEVLARAIELGKPFAIVLPVATLACRYFAQLLADDDSVRIVIPLSRLQFLKDRKQTKSCSFSTMFVTRGLNQYLQCPRQIMYIDNSGPATPKIIFETDRPPIPIPSFESLRLEKIPVESAYDPSRNQPPASPVAGVSAKRALESDREESAITRRRHRPISDRHSFLVLVAHAPPARVHGGSFLSWYRAQVPPALANKSLAPALSILLRFLRIARCRVPESLCGGDAALVAADSLAGLQVPCALLTTVAQPEDSAQLACAIYLHVVGGPRPLPTAGRPIFAAHIPPMPLDQCLVVLDPSQTSRTTFSPPCYAANAADSTRSLDLYGLYARAGVMLDYRRFALPLPAVRVTVLREAILVRALPRPADTVAAAELGYAIECANAQWAGFRGLLATREAFDATVAATETTDSLWDTIVQAAKKRSDAVVYTDPDTLLAWVHAGFALNVDLFQHHAVARVMALALMAAPANLAAVLSIADVDILRLPPSVAHWAGGSTATLPLAAFVPPRGGVVLVIVDSGETDWERLCRVWARASDSTFVLVGRSLERPIRGFKWGETAYRIVGDELRVRDAIAQFFALRATRAYNRGKLAELYSRRLPLDLTPSVLEKPDTPAILRVGWFGAPAPRAR